MGNATSMNGKSPKTLEHVVNYIAAQYIRKQNFKELSNLSNKEYCDDLVILTSKIIKEHLDGNTIKYLALKKGIAGNNIIKGDKVIAIDKKSLGSLDVKNPIKKQRLCIGVAKHYVQIAHIFAAISSTLNPQYTYRDVSGETVETPLVSKENIPGEVEAKITRHNLCSNRLKVLLGNIDYNDLNNMSELKINPTFCSLNKDKTLSDEPGIPELKQLYLDKYDYSTGTFTEMTPEMEKIYQKDVETLYKAFSGNKSIPIDQETGEPSITRFSKIPLKDFYTSEGCVSGKYNQSVTGSIKKRLFQEYSDNIKQAMVTIKTYNGELLELLDKIFVFGINPETQDKQIFINPKLTDDEVKEISDETRSIIIQLYVSCEENFLKGLEIYEAIIKKQKFDTTKSQINNLQSALQESVPEIKDEISPATAEISPATAEISPATAETHPEPDIMASQAKDAIGTAVEKTKDAVGNAVGTAVEQTKDAVGNVVDQTKDAVGNVVEQTKDAVGTAVEQTKAAVGTAVEQTKDAVGNVVEQTKDTVGNVVEQTKDTVGNALQETKADVGSTVHTVENVATADVNKVKTAGIDAAKTAEYKGEQLTQNIKANLPQSPHSPRSVTWKLGGKKKKLTRRKKRNRTK